ncbi:glycosyltransferase involved in cell wall bisynthesis [Rhodobacter sp. JA431]|uniref:glycosyltransferase family 4 protein n=1 Tax=Rhodobacter sp. JA431 TaxID=570013 RepID=UPI000BD811C8|nr:glycosyltransferase family 4 protein [Rhodobacter sp. JA431]SOB97709.1 glycosyltransferase involved in cell wall bisynthesis [Rhodobacter sp. JA431]
MLTILCVHQGVEKYGSDKSFVAAVSALQASLDVDTQILLPGEGSIDDLIRGANLRPARSRYLWVLRKAGFVKSMTLGLPRNLIALFRAIRDLKKYDLVYVNTAVIVDFLFASILTRRRVIVHVREIPVGIAMNVIRKLLILAKSQVIFNSHATAQAFNLPKGQQQVVVYNGFETPEPFTKDAYDGTRALRVLCIGRLNAWKGQEVLVRACTLLSDDERSKLRLRIVGGVYKDQTHFRTALETQITTSELSDTIVMQDFVDDPAEEYRKADIVVVPSTLPEPFGRVAIEGMAYGCSVIASDNGGLSEIVVDGETGSLVLPGDPEPLAEALRAALHNPASVARQGTAGQHRFAQVFTQARSDENLVAMFARQPAFNQGS